MAAPGADDREGPTLPTGETGSRLPAPARPGPVGTAAPALGLRVWAKGLGVSGFRF